MSERSGADTLLDCYRGEELEVTANTTDSHVDGQVGPAEIGRNETEPRATEEVVEGPNRDVALEQMMEDVKGFIRKIDINNL